jgi:hypothetical protein
VFADLRDVATLNRGAVIPPVGAAVRCSSSPTTFPLQLEPLRIREGVSLPDASTEAPVRVTGMVITTSQTTQAEDPDVRFVIIRKVGEARHLHRDSC